MNPNDAPAEMQGGDVSQVVEHLFRHESGKMVAILTRIFGVEHLTLAEDVVQEALVRALKTWPFYGVPKNPAAWIMRASRNLALDVVRRQKVFRAKEPEIVQRLEQPGPTQPGSGFSENEINDDHLRMMFACCHPLIAPEAQVALALKTLCGFGIAEISRAFLTSEAAIAKRLTRAKQKIIDARVPFEIPEGEELTSRLDGVLHCLYLLFNEGYKASSGEKLVREELCHEAIRLTKLLSDHVSGDQPQTHALLALMLLNAGRLPGRLSIEGNLLRLQEQDRTCWDQTLIARGMFHFARSTAGGEITQYHLQAGIAACHCAAKDYESTDWKQILVLYDRLVAIDDSPVIALNRSVVLAKLFGPERGLESIVCIPDLKKLESYYLLHAVRGELKSQLNDREAAARHFKKSLDLVELKSERLFLTQRLTNCEAELPN